VLRVLRSAQPGRQHRQQQHEQATAVHSWAEARAWGRRW
jgi:hypothetical protein